MTALNKFGLSLMLIAIEIQTNQIFNIGEYFDVFLWILSVVGGCLLVSRGGEKK